jgi:hypothetical protein
MKSFESLASFATDDRIIRLVAKERGKYTAKSNGKGDAFKTDPLFLKLKGMTPPHRLWSDPGWGKLPERKDRGIAKWTGRKRRAAVRVYRAIRKWYGRMPDAPWVQKLEEFIAEVRADLDSRTPLQMETPRVLPKFKEQDLDSGDFIFRPLCQYRDLKTKIILALAYQYFVTHFDRYFHKNMLFMRGPRREADGRHVVPKYQDAIDMVSAYRREQGRKPIFVGECDIQKFFDIFNHDVIVDCFEDLFDVVKRDWQVSDADFDPLRRVLSAYLASFNYPEHVMAKNDDPAFWEREKNRYRSEKCPDPVCRFKWVKEEAFVASGCYTVEEFCEARDGKKLGVPQGGALSGIIVNVVMRVVDKPIVTPVDPDRLFIRYCDDILLMHTDRARCESYLDDYYAQLLKCRLVPHPRKDVGAFKHGKKTAAGFWHSKTKNVYLWGPGPGDASEWVAFVGYEMRRTGEIRIRKDKIDAEFRKIAKKYYDIIYSNAVKSGEPLSEEEKAELIARMDKLPEHLLDYDLARDNLYTRSQARRLDKYHYRKTRIAAARIGISDPEAAAKARVTYLEIVKEKV